jgi:hypothetical protein
MSTWISVVWCNLLSSQPAAELGILALRAARSPREKMNNTANKTARAASSQLLGGLLFLFFFKFNHVKRNKFTEILNIGL